MNPSLSGFTCLRWEAAWPLDDYFEGCPACLADGHPSSLRPVFRDYPNRISNSGKRGLARYADWLVYGDWPSLGEGDTPLVDLPGQAAALGLGALVVKNEGANPTGSHKDRMSMLCVARALAVGARTVVAASSGNAGVSLAAYAARAGLECKIVVTPAISPNWRRAIEMHGAELVATRDHLSRWRYVERQVRAAGWYPATNHLTPPVGSNPYGVDGYRTIAFELAEDPGVEAIDHVVVPTARADLIWGIARGFFDLERAGIVTRVPRIHAVEPFPRAARVVTGADYREEFEGDTAMASIAGGTVTFQTLDALALGGGTVVAVEDEVVHSDQAELARCGLYFELSSAAALSGVRALIARGEIAAGERVVLIATSHGFKEWDGTRPPLKPID